MVNLYVDAIIGLSSLLNSVVNNAKTADHILHKQGLIDLLNNGTPQL